MYDTSGSEAIWAKTFPDGGTKPLIGHLLDVAAVARELQDRSRPRVAREAEALGIEPRQLADLRVWLAALHDLGKCSAAFQCKSSDRNHWPEAVLGDFRQPKDPGHWRSTATLLKHRTIWPRLLSLMPYLGPQQIRNLLPASAGHHGRPPDDADWSRSIEPVIGDAALSTALQIFNEVCAVVRPPEDLELDRLQSLKLSWQAAGLVTVADWVGSDAEFFGPGRVGDLDAYYHTARAVALRALDAKGLLPKPVSSSPGLAAIAPGLSTPRPMQVWANTVDLPCGPCLAVVEDVTGSGKTEAALALASRMMAAGKGEGVYFALPTEATANAMFDRLEAAHRGLYSEGSGPSLVLAHGRAYQSEPFARVRQAPSGSTEAQCNAWIADHRRKAFFADVGAGTIDQAFLAILQKRYLSLRQFGLAGRILVVDEAHAFDSYMAKELSRLLDLQAQSGGSTIVLSATLPNAKRADLLRAYAPGWEPDQYAFPLATLASATGILESPVAAAAAGRRRVEVHRLESVDQMHDLAADAAREGGAVLVLRNAVDEAIASAAALQAMGCDTDLFHARFAHVDRARIEKRVLGRFGKDSTTQLRTGQVLVATQVVEQSLDLDFDVIFTDLAPIDMLIQRAGRLWRHERNGRTCERPDLYVLSPSPEGEIDAA